MTWTYTPSQLSSSKLMQVRLLIGDTISTDPQLADEEINFFIAQRPSPYGAAALACRAIASGLSRQADTVDKDLRSMYSSRSKAYGLRASDYEVKASVRGGGLPYAGGISIADKIQNETDPDRVQPYFAVDMDTNYIPVAPIGNEGTPEPEGSDDD